MESLIVLARGSAVVDNDGLARAMLRDTLAIAHSWRSTQTGVDLNRRVVVIADSDGVVDEDDVVDIVVAAADTSDDDAIASAADADFARGARAVAAITARTPTLPSYLLDHAFRALQFEPVVVGPTAEGAAWLTGVQRGARATAPSLGRPGALSALSADAFAAIALLPFWYLLPEDPGGATNWLWHLAGGRRGDSIAAATLSVLRRPVSEGPR